MSIIFEGGLRISIRATWGILTISSKPMILERMSWLQQGLDDLLGNPQYNANISGIKWQADGANPGIKGYGFDYDQINRMKFAGYGMYTEEGWNTNYENFTVSGITYDQNGNINTLKRYGVNYFNGSSYGFGAMDSLNYSYSGNQLTAVNDSVNDFGFSNNDFSDNSSTGYQEYEYAIKDQLGNVRVIFADLNTDGYPEVWTINNESPPKSKNKYWPLRHHDTMNHKELAFNTLF